MVYHKYTGMVLLHQNLFWKYVERKRAELGSYTLVHTRTVPP